MIQCGVLLNPVDLMWWERKFVSKEFTHPNSIHSTLYSYLTLYTFHPQTPLLIHTPHSHQTSPTPNSIHPTPIPHLLPLFLPRTLYIPLLPSLYLELPLHTPNSHSTPSLWLPAQGSIWHAAMIFYSLLSKREFYVINLILVAEQLSLYIV